jgi:anti-anti-sigma factor
MIEVQSDPTMGIQLKPLSDLDWVGASSLRHVLHDVLHPGIKLVIDLSQVDFIDAVGISAVVGSIRRVRAAGGTVELCNPRPPLRRLLELIVVSGSAEPILNQRG